VSVRQPELALTRAHRMRGGATWQHVYALLREAIVSVELEPGQQLSENDLAERIGVSRTPIREALVRLRDDRLVEIVPQLGTFVTRISPAALADAQFVRESLECAAVRLAAQRSDAESVHELETILQRQAETHAGGDLDRFYVLDDDFHRAMCELSGRTIAWELSQRASGHLNRIRRLSLAQPDYISEMIDEHHAVLSAIANRKPSQGEKALRHHLRMVLSSLPDIEAGHPEFFAGE
jgi:GntR family transcriptional regulator, rspAB operon transcriptional repressor